MPVAPLGTMGTVMQDNTTNPWQHRVGLGFLAIYIWSVLTTTLRMKVPFFKKNFPLRAPQSDKELVQLWLIIMGASWFYYSIVCDSARFPEEIPFIANRGKYYIGAMIFYTMVYYFCRAKVFHNLDTKSRDTQSSNVVRVMVKFGGFCYWAPFDFFQTATMDPLQLTDEVYLSGYHVCIGITSLYAWEMLFRDLQPVNVMHHAIACIGAGCVLEWCSVLEPVRTLATMPMLASVMEGFCCMGTMAYRLLPKGDSLKRIMAAETIFILVAYNLNLAGLLMQYIAFYDLFGPAWKISMMSLPICTWPAQMNMARVFYVLYTKSNPKPVSSESSNNTPIPVVLKEAAPLPPPRRRRA